MGLQLTLTAVYLRSTFILFYNFAESTQSVTCGGFALGLLVWCVTLVQTEVESPRHGGESVAAVLRAHGVKYIFTLVGGHISPILVACEKVGIRIVDTRHEATAVFAADAVARLSGAFLRNILNTTVFKYVYTLMFEELIMGS